MTRQRPSGMFDSPLAVAGLVLLVIGVCWLFTAFNMPNTVPGSFGDRIYNLPRADARRTQLIIACVWLVIGTILITSGLGKTMRGSASESLRKCSFCAENIQREAIICKHCGHDVSISTESQETAPSEVRVERLSITEAVVTGDVDLVQRLIDEGVDVNLRNEHGHTALQLATRRGDQRMIDLLLENSAQ